MNKILSGLLIVFISIFIIACSADRSQAERDGQAAEPAATSNDGSGEQAPAVPERETAADAGNASTDDSRQADRHPEHAGTDEPASNAGQADKPEDKPEDKPSAAVKQDASAGTGAGADAGAGAGQSSNEGTAVHQPQPQTNGHPAEETPAQQPQTQPTGETPAAEPQPAPQPASPPPAATTHRVEIAGFEFSPAVLEIKAGDSVTFTNRDSAKHTATADDSSFDTGLLAKNESNTVTFGNTGEYGYYCAPHPGMRGTIIVK